MKLNSRILGILTVLFAVSIVISAVGAVDLANNGNFTMAVPEDSDFREGVATDVHVNDISLNMVVYENSGSNSDDLESILYLEDFTDDSNILSDLFDDLKKDGEIIEDNDNYVIFKTQHSVHLFDVNVTDDFNSFMTFVGSIFSPDANVGLSADGNDIAISDNGLKIHDNDGGIVSISDEGVSFYNQASSDEGNVSSETNVTVDGDVGNIQSGDYVAYIKNQNNDRVILLIGNNLNAVKEVADSTSFNS